MKITKLLFFAAALFALAACNDDKEKPKGEWTQSGHGLFIVGQGMFTQDNSSLEYYDPVTKIVDQRVFYAVNGFIPGSLMQSMTAAGDRGYIVMNGSDLIYVVDLSTMKLIKEIEGLTSPRYAVVPGNGKIYVSHMSYGGSLDYITVIDEQSCEVTGTIKLGTDFVNPERMVCSGNYLYVVCWTANNKVLKIDLQSNTVAASLDVHYQPSEIIMDGNGMLWIASDGGWDAEGNGLEAPAITVVNPANMTVIHELILPDPDAQVISLNLSADKKKILYVYNGYGTITEPQGVYTLTIDPSYGEMIPELLIAQPASSSFYDMAVDPITGEIYVTDALDYTQRGKVYRYSSNGRTIVDTFTVGISPKGFCFVD